MINRSHQLELLAKTKEPFDVLVIGGGATGAGIAVDAASRGYSVCLLERADFGSGTSSRSTKLVHGGVRYLKQGNISLVMEALRERGRLLQNAPHLVHDLPFVVPNYDFWEAPFYGIGMKIYDALAGRYRFGRSKILSFKETIERIPTISQKGLRGGVEYHDGQFDDARLLINLITTAVNHDAVGLNYFKVTDFIKNDEGLISGVQASDALSGKIHSIHAKSFVNATGCFCEDLIELDTKERPRLVAPSQGAHIILDRSFLPSNSAILVPETSDGRVIFAVPWRDHVLVGTTDTPIEQIEAEPHATDEEIEFLLNTAGQYLDKVPRHSDILAVHCGIRPLIHSGDANTASLSRDHHIEISVSGLLTIAGGKWTTYRKMAEDAVDHLTILGGLVEKECKTKNLKIHGAPQDPLTSSEESSDQRLPKHMSHLHYYGTDAEQILKISLQMPDLGHALHPDLELIGAEIVWAARHEAAERLSDALLRRSRVGVIREQATLEILEKAADIMAKEKGWSDARKEAEIEEVQELLAPSRRSGDS